MIYVNGRTSLTNGRKPVTAVRAGFSYTGQGNAAVGETAAQAK